MNDVRALCDAPHIAGLIDFIGAYHESESGQASNICIPSYADAACIQAVCMSRKYILNDMLVQIAIVLEYMDAGSLGDLLQKVMARTPQSLASKHSLTIQDTGCSRNASIQPRLSHAPTTWQCRKSAALWMSLCCVC